MLLNFNRKLMLEGYVKAICSQCTDYLHFLTPTGKYIPSQMEFISVLQANGLSTLVGDSLGFEVRDNEFRPLFQY